jgi:hypothetical protein
MSTGFHPERYIERSPFGDDSMGDWLMKEVTGDLRDLPGIGPVSVKALNKQGITTTYQLFGKFLSLKEEGVGSVELADRFWFWLDSAGTHAGSRAAIVLAVAEKLNLSFPGLYDGSLYEPLEDK